MDSLERFGHDTYTVRRKIFNLISTKFHIYGPDDSLVMFCKMKGFKLKEDIRLYSDENMITEILTIQADRVIDFSAAYTVVDAQSGEKVGALRRKGFKSILRDEWTVLNANGQDMGKIIEDSTFKAIARRIHGLVSVLMPQKYHVEFAGKTVCTIQQNMNPFVVKVVVDFTPDTGNLLDPRLGLAGAVLMCAIEGKQN